MVFAHLDHWYHLQPGTLDNFVHQLGVIIYVDLNKGNTLDFEPVFKGPAGTAGCSCVDFDSGHFLCSFCFLGDFAPLSVEGVGRGSLVRVPTGLEFLY